MPSKDFNHIPDVIRSLSKEEDRSASAVAQYVAHRATVYAPMRTGRLSSRIRVEREGKGQREVVSDTGGAGFREYAAYNEYGTRYMSAQPYMGPAAVDGIKYMDSRTKEIDKNVTRSARTGRAV